MQVERKLTEDNIRPLNWNYDVRTPRSVERTSAIDRVVADLTDGEVPDENL